MQYVCSKYVHVCIHMYNYQYVYLCTRERGGGVGRGNEKEEGGRGDRSLCLTGHVWVKGRGQEAVLFFGSVPDVRWFFTCPPWPGRSCLGSAAADLAGVASSGSRRRWLVNVRGEMHEGAERRRDSRVAKRTAWAAWERRLLRSLLHPLLPRRSPRPGSPPVRPFWAGIPSGT